MVPFSLLDLSPILQGSDASTALRNTLDLAQHAERWGYRRFWLAEHHNMPGIASAATSVVVGYVAGGTSTIRVGSGGIMLPNHSPLVIAEQFGTLAALYPGRIDLGVGRAPGTDMQTARAFRRARDGGANFAEDVMELRSYFEPATPGQVVRAVPGAGLDVPIWVLGSSLFGAQVAAALGLPFAFASHFAPADLLPALEIYRRQFRPSAALDRPHAMAAFGVFAAESEAEARRLFTSAEQQFINLRRGRPGPLQPPVDDMDDYAAASEREQMRDAYVYSIVGDREAVRTGVARFVAATGVDEILVTAQIYDHAARLRSFEILADVCSVSLAA